MISKYAHLILVLVLALVSGLVLAGCGRLLHQDTALSSNRVQVEQGQTTQSLDVGDVDEEYLYALSSHYRAKGDGALILSVTYDATSSEFTAMQASQEMARISSLLDDYGVHDIDARILPVPSGAGQMMVSYTTYDALPPKDCEYMPGVLDVDVSYNDDYKFGCSVESMLARQIAHPKDLKRGRPITKDEVDGRVHSNIIEYYRLGEINNALEGESATGE